MGFQDDLRRELASGSATKIHVADSVLSAFVESYYQERLEYVLTNIKANLRSEINKRIEGQRTFEIKTTFGSRFGCHYSSVKRLSQNINALPGNYIGNNLFFKVFSDDEGDFIQLNDLYTVEDGGISFWGGSHFLKVELTDSGKKFYEDILQNCKQDGILVSTLYGKTDKGDKFELGKMEKVRMDYMHNLTIYFNCKIEL